MFKLDSSGTLEVLHAFNDQKHGGEPNGDLIGDLAGNLYGTTAHGGAHRFGTVFKLTRTGTLRTLYSFTDGADGASPWAGLIRDSAGNLYGTTQTGGDFNCFLLGGCGTVFKIDAIGTFTVLHSFNGTDGATPTYSRLARDAAGNLYGTTEYGGDIPQCDGFGCGTVFKLDPTGTITVLHSFSGGDDGSVPLGTLIQDPNGTLYGTTAEGGTYGYGTVFKVDPATDEFGVLHEFSGVPDGAGPYVGLIWNGSGRLVGTTGQGGTYGHGTIFEISTH